MRNRTAVARRARVRGAGVVRIVLTVAALALALASCAGDDGEAAAGGGGGPQAISFTAPEAGAEVSSPVAFTLDSGGEEIGKPETGNRHFHLYVDDSSEYEIVYATEGELEVPEGEHTIRAVLAEPNHDETDISTEMDVTVTGGGGAPAEEPDEPGGGYGY